MKKIFRWIFSEEIAQLQDAIKRYDQAERKLKNVIGNIDISVDVHQYSKSWACISIQGQKDDFIKFIDLGEADIRQIASFLRHFDRDKIDAYPGISNFIRMEKDRFSEKRY